MSALPQTAPSIPPAPSAPRRILRRAAGLLNSNGQPTVVELSDINDPILANRKRGENKLGASIKRKFMEVKDASKFIGRSRSLTVGLPSSISSPEVSQNGDTNLDAIQRRKGHARSHSDVQGTRPTILQSQGVPEYRQYRQSTQVDTLARVAELTTHSILESSSSTSGNGDQLPDSMADVTVPRLLQEGTPMTKVSNKKHKKAVFRLDPDQGQIVWESKAHRIIPIETIKELRSGSDARYYREQFQLAQDYEDRWLTIIYILDGTYKTLHLIAATKDVFRMWDTTLRKLHAIRQELMSGLGNIEMRQAIWEKQYWKGADEEQDQKLEFGEVEKLCKRLNVHLAKDDLERLFKQADTHSRNYLDFSDFRRFVRLLKQRPELDRLYKKLRADGGGRFHFNVFEQFMRDSQKSDLSQAELQCIFEKYATNEDIPVSPTKVNSPEKQLPRTPASVSVPLPSPLSSPIIESRITPSYVMTIEGFTSFLLSTDNSAFSYQNGKIWHDMTRPLSEYYISSSHNTYLVGHQLVGVSTIEGYIRALLHSCRSVELDIYDGDHEPMIFHGKTFTSKVSLREVCQAIAKYGFIASPYPIIISAEIHCGVAQQDMMVDIMMEVFGDALIRAPIDGRPKIDALPSPEDLKGMILLKAKNLYILQSETPDSESVSTDTSASSTSDSDAVHEHRAERRKSVARDSDVVAELKQEFLKARNVVQRVRSRRKTPSPLPVPVPDTPPLTPHTPYLTPGLSSRSSDSERPKVKMSFALVALLVYTVGVKWRGINKKEEYAPEHIFSLSENTANKILKQSMIDLIKHNRTHLVRIYPKGMRLNSTNYEPHRYWSAGAQLVAINWQTFDLGYMINHAMFQRNGRSGYVLKPLALRMPQKDLLSKRTKHFLDVTIISAQQLPRTKDASGREVMDKSLIDPFVEVSIHVPDWTHSPFLLESSDAPGSPVVGGKGLYSPPATPNMTNATSARTVSYRTGVVKNNGFNPVWQEELRVPFDCVGDMKDLIFVRFTVRQEGKDSDVDEPLAVYCASLGSLQHGYRHLPLHDGQLSQYLFSTLFVRIGIHDVVD